MSEAFCSNPKCMYHRIDIDESATCVELETDDYTPVIVVDSQPKVLHRASLVNHGKVMAKFCEVCMSALDTVHEIRRGNIMPM